MVATDKLFAGSIPDIYDRFLVPLIFEAYARDLAGRLAKTEPRDVLEIAAGTGVLTRAIAARLPGDVRIVATDLNQPMLDHAAARQPHDDRPHDGRIQWRQADALALPFEDHSFDVVACQFGVMFFPDKVQGYKEARRVLKPGGHFFFNVWDRISENEFADVVTQALAALFPEKQGRLATRRGDCLLPGDAAEERDRGARCLTPGRRDETGGRRLGGAIWKRRHRRPHPGIRDHRHSLRRTADGGP